jgi:hypothetical protein
MTKTRLMILVLLSVCSAFSICWGLVAERSAKGRIADFKLAYYDTKCLLRHCDPYSESEVWNVYTGEGNTIPTDPVQRRLIAKSMPSQVYLPSAFLFVVPFALLDWNHAHILWMVLTATALTWAAFLIFQIGAVHAPDISFYLICFMLVNCGVIYAGGNAAGIAVSLCIIGAWSFLENRYVFFGILFFGASLAIKPHDTGLVWLYFVLAGGIQRKRALQSLIVTVVISVPALIWINYTAPNWLQEVRGNLVATSTEGGNADPGPSSSSQPGPGMIIDLQTVVSVFRNEPHFYNTITYVICGPLLFAWVFVTARTRISSTEAWFALAAISVLSMIPLYHRPYDAKLLLLTVPACAMLMAEGGVLGRAGLVLNSAAIVLTADLPLGALAMVSKKVYVDNGGLLDRFLAILVGRPVPLVLLALGTFYLWIYVRKCRSGVAEGSEINREIVS